jgi:hypothetical protein
MGNAPDPRTDRHPDKDTPNIPVPKGDPKDAPGGVGTGTRNDPARDPAAQPKR